MAECAFMESKCAATLEAYHREHMRWLESQAQEIGEMSAALLKMVEELKDGQHQFVDALRGKTPDRYVPMSVHLVTVGVAIGVSNIQGIVGALQEIAKLWH